MTKSHNWIDYIEIACGIDVRRQFERAIARNSHRFIEMMLSKNASIMRANEYYYGLSNRMNTQGRNHQDALDVALDILDGRDVDWTRYQFVTNPLLR